MKHKVIFNTEYPAVLLDDIEFFAKECGAPKDAEVTSYKNLDSDRRGLLIFEWEDE